MGLNNQQPCHATHMEMPPVKGLTQCFIKNIGKEQKLNWPLHLSSLVFAYNAMPHSVTGYQPYKLIFSHKAPTVCNAWLGLAKYNDQYLQSNSAWVDEQHKLILAANRQALKKIKQTANKTVLHARGSTLNIPKDNLKLLRDHPEGRHKIQDNYKSELFLIVSKHKDPYVYTIIPVCWGLVHIVNQQQLLAFKNHPLGIVRILIAQIYPLKLIYTFTCQKGLNKMIGILPINIHMASGLGLRPTLYSKHKI